MVSGKARCGSRGAESLWLGRAVFGWARSGSHGGVRTVRPSGVSSGTAVAVTLGWVTSDMV